MDGDNETATARDKINPAPPASQLYISAPAGAKGHCGETNPFLSQL